MGILRILLLTVEAVTSLLLIGVILLQKTKGEGLGLAFGSGMGETLFGSRAGNVLTKITVTLGLVFLGNTAILGVLFTRAHETSIIDSRTADMPMAAPAAAPAPMETAPAPAGAGLTAPTLLPGSTLGEDAPAPAVQPAEAAPAPAAETPQP